jgi:hypothetical protein
MGRGARVVNSTHVRSVTADADDETHFALVHCVDVIGQTP